ncbi:MAG: Hsp20/alpha crystallin family protein [Acidobacteriota bacterium]|nr:Hsp20/alpha crystallin family protein [Acidobacteriota bacterium]
MAIAKWDPWGEMVSFRNRIDRWLEEEFGKTLEKGFPSEGWLPSADIRETDKEIIISADLPGIDEKDVALEIENHNLILRGKREFEKETKKEDYRRVERSYGSFFRSFALPASADLDKIKAVHEKGVLKITIPKAPEIKPKKIPILQSGK